MSLLVLEPVHRIFDGDELRRARALEISFMIFESFSGLLVEKTNDRPLLLTILTALPNEVVKASELSTPSLIPTPRYTPRSALVGSQDTTSFQEIVFFINPYLTLIFSESTFMLSFAKLRKIRPKVTIRMSNAETGAGFHHAGGSRKD